MVSTFIIRTFLGKPLRTNMSGVCLMKPNQGTITFIANGYNGYFSFFLFLL